ncbi:hypothetical protein ACFLZH_03880 [Patescibacteria group bacterium]
MNESPGTELPKAEKAKFVKEHEAIQHDEVGKMEKKYDQIHEMAIFHRGLARHLKIDEKEINTYAKRSPKFHDALAKLHDTANTSFENFKKWYDSHMENVRGVTTQERKQYYTVILANLRAPMRKKTIIKFTKVKDDMKKSIKEMIETEKKREKIIGQYLDIPAVIANETPGANTAALQTKLEADLQYADDLALLRTKPFKEVKAKFTNDYLRKVYERLKKVVHEPMPKEFIKFSKLRDQRRQLKQKLRALDPRTDFGIPEHIEEEVQKFTDLHGDLNIDHENNPWPLKLAITDSNKYFHHEGFPNKENINELSNINKTLEMQIEALELMILSKQAEKAVYDLNELGIQFTDLWDKHGADPSKSQSMMLNFIGANEKIFDFETPADGYLDPKEAHDIIQQTQTPIAALKHAIKEFKDFEDIKNSLIAKNKKTSVPFKTDWTLAGIDTPEKMTKLLDSMEDEEVKALAALKTKKGRRKSRRA